MLNPRVEFPFASLFLKFRFRNNKARLSVIRSSPYVNALKCHRVFCLESIVRRLYFSGTDCVRHYGAVVLCPNDLRLPNEMGFHRDGRRLIHCHTHPHGVRHCANFLPGKNWSHHLLSRWSILVLGKSFSAEFRPPKTHPSYVL